MRRRRRAQRRSRMPEGHRRRRRAASWTAASTAALSMQRRATIPRRPQVRMVPPTPPPRPHTPATENRIHPHMRKDAPNMRDFSPPLTRGAGIVPWRLDGARLEEDIFHLAASQPRLIRALTVEGCRIPARQFREQVEAHARSRPAWSVVSVFAPSISTPSCQCRPPSSASRIPRDRLQRLHGGQDAGRGGGAASPTMTDAAVLA
jgi:hypothetical protein